MVALEFFLVESDKLRENWRKSVSHLVQRVGTNKYMFSFYFRPSEEVPQPYSHKLKHIKDHLLSDNKEHKNIEEFLGTK